MLVLVHKFIATYITAVLKTEFILKILTASPKEYGHSLLIMINR